MDSFKVDLYNIQKGYRTRQVMKVPDVSKLRQNIIETDDGTYGNPQIRQKKIRLIRMIEGYLQNGQYYKKLKRIKSSQKQFPVNNQWQDNEFVQNDNYGVQQNYYPKPQQFQQKKVQQQFYDENIQNEYLEQPISQYEQYLNQQSAFLDQKDERIKQNQAQPQFSNSRPKVQHYLDYGDKEFSNERPANGNGSYEASYNDDRPIVAKGKYEVKNEEQENEFDQYDMNQTKNQKKKGDSQYNYVNDKPIGKNNNMQDDERPIGGKGTYDAFQDDERPIGGKGTYANVEDERPLAGKGKYQFNEDERPIGGKKSFQNFEDEQPIGGKGTYDEIEDELPKKSKPIKKKAPPKAKPAKQVQEQINLYEDQNEPPAIQDQYPEEAQDQEKQKSKKKDPKLLENLKKRTKYDPRKAIQQAKQKQEEQQLLEQIEAEAQQEQEEKVMPKVKTQQIQSQQVLPEKKERSATPIKLNLSATQEKSTPAKDQIGECSPKEDPFLDSKPKNFLKRKSKQVPLNNPKVDPKQVKSKVKNCWNGNSNLDDPDLDFNEDLPQSPKANMTNKSPSRKFEQKSEQSNQQQQTQTKQPGPMHVQVQLVQQPQHQYQPNQQQSIQQQKRVIQIEELEKAYNSNYSQKFETTMKNLKSLVQERLQHSEGGVPIITTRSRFFTTFKVNDFDRLLSQLEDQYNKLQITK